MRRSAWICIVSLILMSGSGCSVLTRNKDARPIPASRDNAALPKDSAEVVAWLNERSALRKSMLVDDLFIEGNAEGRTASIKGWMVCDRPKNFRLQGRAFGVDQVDIGSNQERFWFWVKQSPEPHLFHCSYTDFEKGIQLPFPFQPEWVAETLGMSDYNPDGNYRLEFKGKTFELIETTTLQNQPVKKITIINADKVEGTTPKIIAYEVRDLDNKLICGAKIERVRADKKTGLAYPSLMTLNWPASQLKMKMELNDVTLNDPIQGEQAMKYFSLPQWKHTQQVDLGNIRASNRIQPVGARR
jgi:hypothetical protein